jgi:aldose 1-epimerase
MPFLELQNPHLRLVIRPDLGGSIAGLWFNGAGNELPVLRSTAPEALHNVRLSASYPLAPFSNRLAQAQLHWNGTGHPLVQNATGEAHAIHGIVWQKAWEVIESSEHMAMLACHYDAQPGSWPFSFDCSQVFQLRGNTLHLTLSITNQSPQAAPVGLGWHPNFVKRPGSHISFAAAGIWDMGPDMLPTQRQASSGLDRSCADLDIDHCFDGWAGTVQLRDERITSRISASVQRLVVYTGPDKNFVSIEPVSHVNNAMNLIANNPSGKSENDLFGIRILQPGESYFAEMAIAVEKSA